MVYDFFLNGGKIIPVNDPDVPDLGNSANIVLYLAQTIPSYKTINFILTVGSTHYRLSNICLKDQNGVVDSANKKASLLSFQI